MIGQFGVVHWAKKNRSDQVSEYSRMAAEATRIQNYYLKSGQKTLNRMLKSFGDSAFDDMDRGTMQKAKRLLQTDIDSMRAGEKPGYYTGEWLTEQLRDPRHKG